jgi:hypothetical protein
MTGLQLPFHFAKSGWSMLRRTTPILLFGSGGNRWMIPDRPYAVAFVAINPMEPGPVPLQLIDEAPRLFASPTGYEARGALSSGPGFGSRLRAGAPRWCARLPTRGIGAPMKTGDIKPWNGESEPTARGTVGSGQ